MSTQGLRNLLRWGGLAIAIAGYVLGRTAQSAGAFRTGRAMIWTGLGMIVGGMVVRLFVRNS